MHKFSKVPSCWFFVGESISPPHGQHWLSPSVSLSAVIKATPKLTGLKQQGFTLAPASAQVSGAGHLWVVLLIVSGCCRTSGAGSCGLPQARSHGGLRVWKEPADAARPPGGGGWELAERHIGRLLLATTGHMTEPGFRKWQADALWMGRSAKPGCKGCGYRERGRIEEIRAITVPYFLMTFYNFFL